MNTGINKIALYFLAVLFSVQLSAQVQTDISQKDADSQKVGDLYIVSNSHLDTQWSWTVEQTIDEFLPKTLDQNFALFEKYPNFNFNFEGAIRYMFAKEYYPEKYEQLKNYIALGRWMPAGGSIDANDVMVPSAESIIRNFLYGQAFFKKEFGVRGGRDIMLPDCFGFPYSLPTLGKHCGMEVFHTAKLTWGSADYGKLYNYQNWQGVDGSKILAVVKPQAYDSHTGYQKDISKDNGLINEAKSNKEKLGVPTVFRYIGPVGDQGGAVPDANGEWMEVSLRNEGPLKVHLASPTQFLESFTQEELDAMPVWDNELPMRTHGVGCYTSKTILKYWNRKNELLADATEKSSYPAHWLGGLTYQEDLIRDSWMRILWHQFHDDLTGTSLPKAYTYTQNDHFLAQLDLSKTLTNSVGAVARKLSTQVEGIPLVVYNPLSIQRKDIVEASVQLDVQPNLISVYDKENKAVPVQMLDYEDGVLSFIFLADVPSLGYEVYELRVDDESAETFQTNLHITNNTLENEEYKITLNANGDVASIIDKKQNNKELLSSPIRMLMLYNDPKSDHPSWEIAYATVAANPTEYVDENVTVTIDENGPLRSSLKITKKKAGSEFVQFVRLTAFGSTDRIDFVNEVDWRTKQRLLKVEFPLTANNPKASFDTSIGAIERGNMTSNLYELNGHQWADLTHNDNSYGVSILNDCKYGWDKPKNNILRLTLIHTPIATWVYPYQAIQDIGLNLFTYSFYRHTGKWDERTQWEASKLNQPLLAFESLKYDGELGKSFEFVKLNTEKVAVKALKKAENSDDMIIRLYELEGKEQNDIEITFPANIVAAKEVNGVEEEIEGKPVHFSDNTLYLSMTKFQPRTFAVKLASAPSSLQLQNPKSVPVTLDYDIDVFSTNDNRSEGRFGRTFTAYPAELIEDEIESEGVRFAIGNREGREKNALRCKGQEIDLLAYKDEKSTKLYFLAASQREFGSKAEFKVDDAAYEFHIEYFADFLGLFNTPYAEGYYKQENAAYIATHSHDLRQKKDIAYNYLYMFKYMIPIADDAKTLTLPDDQDIIVFAVTLSDNQNDDVQALTEITSLPVHKYIQPEDEFEACGDYLKPNKVRASGFMFRDEAPEYAADLDPFTKWCDNSRNKWLEYDFGEDVEICQWNVTHAGIEDENSITSDFSLQRYDEKTNTFVDVDVVVGNTKSRTNRIVAPFITKKVRLAISKAEQKGDAAARIYSFNLYGRTENFVSAVDDVKEDLRLLGNHPNPFKEFTKIKYNTPEKASLLKLDVYNIAGSLISTQKHKTSGGIEEIEWQNKSRLSGVYFYSVTAYNGSKFIHQETNKMIVER